MRKVLISIAAAGTALAFATPASGQYFPAQQPGYGNGGYGGGYQNGGQMRSQQMRIDMIQRQIEQLRMRGQITRNEVNGLRSEARSLERRLYQMGRYGLNPNEARTIDSRIARLEQHVRHEVADGNRQGGRGYSSNGYNGGYGTNGYNNGGYSNDRDRDGRDDRYEDDHGRDSDNN